MISQAQLEKKVSDYLRKSQALEDYWQRPITAEQLQAEMHRMAKHTRQPEVLRELFAALGNDPFVIAECLARPALGDRLLTSWYAYDQRIHGEIQQRAQAELLAHPSVEQSKQLSGKYTEIEFVKSDSTGKAGTHADGNSVQLNSREWDQTVQKLARIFGSSANQPPIEEAMSATTETITRINNGILSPLQEDEADCLGRLRWQRPIEHWREVLRSIWSHADTHPYSNTYTLHWQMFTYTKTAPDARTAAVIRSITLWPGKL